MSAPDPGREAPRWLDRPENVRRVLRGLYALCALLLAADLAGALLHALGLGELRHRERSWEGIPGFYAVYGFLACTVLVRLAAQLRRALMRPERYYDDD